MHDLNNGINLQSWCGQEERQLHLLSPRSKPSSLKESGLKPSGWRKNPKEKKRGAINAAASYPKKHVISFI
jgi:hypothetical protein